MDKAISGGMFTKLICNEYSLIQMHEALSGGMFPKLIYNEYSLIQMDKAISGGMFPKTVSYIPCFISVPCCPNDELYDLGKQGKVYVMVFLMFNIM